MPTATDLLALLRAVTEYADNLEHDLGMSAGADDAPAMAAAWAVIEVASFDQTRTSALPARKR